MTETPAPAADVEALYRATHARLVRLSFLLTGSQAVAEELVHDAFVRAYPKLCEGEVRDPAAYMRRVVVNLTKAHHRHAAVERRHPPVVPSPVLPADVDETWVALWQLDARERNALVLRFYEDLTVPQIAEVLGCPVGTAKSLIHRGLAGLKEVLIDDR